MRKILFALAILALAVGANAQAFVETFESGINAPWTQYGTTPVTVSTDQNATPGGNQSAMYPAAAVNYQTGLDRIITGGFENWYVDFWLYDTKGTAGAGTRSYLQLQSYDGGGASGNLQQLISVGMYNALPSDQTLYQIRLAVGGVNWTNTPYGRTVGWHNFRLEAYKADPADPTKGLFKLTMDGQPEATWNSPVFPVTRMRVGSGLTTNNIPSYYDDIDFGEIVIPEPGSILALCTGLVGLIGIRRRKS